MHVSILFIVVDFDEVVQSQQKEVNALEDRYDRILYS